MTVLEKKRKILGLLIEIPDYRLEYFDIDSDKNLDRKIEILEQVANGKTLDEVDEELSILELLPDGVWD